MQLEFGSLPPFLCDVVVFFLPQEVLNMLKESKADIFVDPVLHTACALDIKHHCAAIPPGRGRRKCSCLASVTSQLSGPFSNTFTQLEDVRGLEGT